MRKSLKNTGIFLTEHFLQRINNAQFLLFSFQEKHNVDYIVESTKIMAAFSSCEGSATHFVISLNTYTGSEAVVKLESLLLLATP